MLGDRSVRFCIASHSAGTDQQRRKFCPLPTDNDQEQYTHIGRYRPAVNREDLLYIEIVEEIGQKLGRQIAGLISIFNPELVIIGGTLSSTGDYIISLSKL